MEEQTLADLIIKIDELRYGQKNIEQKLIAVIRKLDKLKEYTEIDEMRNIVSNDQSTSIINILYK